MKERNVAVCVKIFTGDVKLFNELFLLKDDIFATELINSHQDHEIGINKR